MALAEVPCLFHRNLREGNLTSKAVSEVRQLFMDDVDAGTWRLLPVTERLLRRVESTMRTLRRDVFLRSADAIHIATALDAGFREIWTNDRHLLAACAHCGIKGRSV